MQVDLVVAVVVTQLLVVTRYLEVLVLLDKVIMVELDSRLATPPQAVAAARVPRPSVDAAPRMHRADDAWHGRASEVAKGARKVWGELMGDVFPESQNAL